MTEFQKRVYEYLRTIPKGKVVTYGELAEKIGYPKACRAVGNALHLNPKPDVYPCFRVVNKEGCLAKNFALGIDEQKRRLENDGIEVVNYKVDLKKYKN